MGADEPMTAQLSGILSERRGAARYRVHALCMLLGDGAPASARMADISAAGTFLLTQSRPALGSRITLDHPEAGRIEVDVWRHEADGIALRFQLGDRAVSFALRAIAANMTQSGPAVPVD